MVAVASVHIRDLRLFFMAPCARKLPQREWIAIGLCDFAAFAVSTRSVAFTGENVHA